MAKIHIKTAFMIMVCTIFGQIKCIKEDPTRKDIEKLCEHLKVLDNRILKALQELPKYEGEYIVKDMTDYNIGLARLADYLNKHRNLTLGTPLAAQQLKDGAPDYFIANIDPDRAKLNFGWLDKGIDEIYHQRAESIKIWTLLNRSSRLISLQYYSYPNDTSKEVYKDSIFPTIQPKKCH